jgi:uncharacterized membrane protein YqjE
MSLLHSARRLAASLVLTGRQRLELAALDIEQELLHAGGAVASMLAIAVLATLALAALSAALAIAMWDRSPVAVLLVLGVLYAVGAVLLARRLLRSTSEKTPFMAATLEELANDERALDGPRP